MSDAWKRMQSLLEQHCAMSRQTLGSMHSWALYCTIWISSRRMGAREYLKPSRHTCKQLATPPVSICLLSVYVGNACTEGANANASSPAPGVVLLIFEGHRPGLSLCCR